MIVMTINVIVIAAVRMILARTNVPVTSIVTSALRDLQALPVPLVLRDHKVRKALWVQEALPEHRGRKVYAVP